MKKILALLLAMAMVFCLCACGSGDAGTDQPENNDNYVQNDEPAGEPADEPADDPANEPAADGFKVGVILVHDENSGYDMAHIEGIWAARDALGLSDDQIIFKYNIGETEVCYDTAVDLAEQGCSLIISDSFGHASYMQQAAEEYPNVTFVSATGDNAANTGLDNLKNIFTYVYESRYVSGVVAGLKLKQLLDEGTVTDPYVGYVGAYPYAEVVSGYTAFFLGIRSIVPEAHMDVTYTNSWYDPVAEGEAANQLMSRGCVIIGQHADSTGAPSAVQAAQDAGSVVYSVGYNIDMLSVAPTAALTSAQNVWGAVYTPTIEKAMKGENLPTDYACGYANGGVCISTLGESCAPGTAEEVARVWAAIADGSLKVFDTSKFVVSAEATDGSYTLDADGHVISAFALDTDGDFVFDSGEAVSGGAFLESTLRSAPSFSFRIEGITELFE